MNKPTGLWVSGPQRNEFPMPPVAPRHPFAPVCAATAQCTRQEPPIGLGGPWKQARGRSLYRALGCGDGVAGVPVVVGALSTVHVMALRSYLWPGAFFNASFVVFMTG